MDMRQTIVDRQAFGKMLQELKDNQQKASLLYEQQGIERAEGFITKLAFTAGGGTVTLHTGLTVNINAIVAINGSFLSDYSEC